MSIIKLFARAFIIIGLFIVCAFFWIIGSAIDWVVKPLEPKQKPGHRNKRRVDVGEYNPDDYDVSC